MPGVREQGGNMFTWNFQYISKTKLRETFNQLMFDTKKGDILVRIHTAIHQGEEAVELAAFIKSLVPKAKILGTSTSAVISGGKLLYDQCIISVTQLSAGSIRSALIPTFDRHRNTPVDADRICERVLDSVISSDTKLMLTFLTGKYADVYGFVEKCNEHFPWVQMLGGVANTPNVSLRNFLDSGFVFNEKGYSDKSLMVATISGESVESFTSFASGAQAVGEDLTITKTDGVDILTINDKNASKLYREIIGEDVKENPELCNMFPYVYSQASDIPFILRYSDDKLTANHVVSEGQKIRQAFIYDRNIISDNRTLFSKIENFEKGETLFAYTCNARSVLYSNCVKWELSTYENTNMCGCITEGEITNVNGKNVFANCTFVVSAVGEEAASQQYNPYVLFQVSTLEGDNKKLLDHLMELEKRYELDDKDESAVRLKEFIQNCETRLFYSENGDLPNEAALNMDINLKGYDRVCIISVLDTSHMRSVFDEDMILSTYKYYTEKCAAFARRKNYRAYVIDRWQVVIAAPSYMVSLHEFSADMQELQRELFAATEEFIAIVPIFCVINGVGVDNIKSVYSAARLEMMQKNIQFHIRDANEDRLDEESIKEKYHMVNVINYALSHDKVIPYYQGIYDNRQKKISHYESLMRLLDENGKVYMPGQFLDVARSYGLLYDSLSFTMIRKVFERFKTEKGIKVSINMSMRDIKNEELVGYIYDFLSKVSTPSSFIFEILENEDVDDYNALVRFVDNIHKYGGMISIDDFGSGYSNLQHIASIHSDFIKIDGSIVKNCCNNRESENIIALLSGWKALTGREVSIVAEYVENEDIQNKLATYEIDYSQGYYFSRPSSEIE